MKIIFFGTPGFASYILEYLIEKKFYIAAVVTAPDKPAGRGKQITESEVKKSALKNNIKVLQPEKLKSPNFFEQLKELNADVFVVIAFRMLPKEVWSIPAKGTFNVHASLLPQYRGAAPINHAIINGEKLTGVTTFFINEEIDTGKIILNRAIEINDNWDAGNLHDVLMNEGALLCESTLLAIENNSVNPIPQEIKKGEILKTAPKLFKENTKINFSKKTNEIIQFCKGLSPYPGAWSILNTGEKKLLVKIYKSSLCKESITNENADSNVCNIGSKLFLKTGNGWLEILELQVEGKKRMQTDELLRGFKWQSSYFFE